MIRDTHVIGLDIGTTSTIALLLRLPGTVVAVAERPNTLSSPYPGWAEEDPQQWWQNACAVLREVLQAEPSARRSLAGLCVTGMVPAMVLLDQDGRVLRPSIQQSDGRCAAEVQALVQEADPDAFLGRTGNGINQQLIAAKLRWIEKHEPETFSQVATVLGSYDYINYRLTGRRAVEFNWALEAGFVELATGKIADELVALGHVARAAIPDFVRAHEVTGHVNEAAAAQSGLPQGLPVFGGAADHIASAFAAGVVSPGDVLLKFGGAGDIIMASETARPDARLFLDAHLVPGLWAPNGCMASTGSALNWLAATIAPDAHRPHAALDVLAAQVAPASDGVLCLPYFLGEKTPIHDPLARGVFSGLSLGHGRGHLWRALLEAVAFGFRHHIEVMRELGYAPRRFLTSDGGSRSRIWMQIVADVLQQPVQPLEAAHGSSVGAAFVAAIGADAGVDWNDVTRMLRLAEPLKPTAGNARAYDRTFADFLELYTTLKPHFRSVAAPR
ncbi:MAG: FGGY-family carbohydrate kinase [Rhizobiaceae bacterium]|nr:FGGY-family carbohydrate kinase [Rhizobiaceae bacterium]